MASGNYLPHPTDQTVKFVVPEEVGIYGGFSGNGLESTLEERDWVSHPTIISGDIGTPGLNTDNSDYLFELSGNGITLDDLILEEVHGVTAITSSGIHSTLLKNLIFRNHVGSNGAALYLNPSVGPQPNRIESCVFVDIDGGGLAGGIYVTTGGGTSHVWEVINSVFSNVTTDNYGAAMYIKSHGNIIGSTFYNNEDRNTVDANYASISIGFGSTEIHNSIVQGSTRDLVIFANSPASLLVENSNVGITAQNGTGPLSLGTGTFNSPVTFLDNVMLAGADNIWFTEDDGLQLLNGSADIDAGVILSPPSDVDILGKSRDANPDLGAYEFIPGPLSANLIAYYDFDNNLDDQIGSANLTEPLGAVPFTTGVSGQGVDFSTSVNYLKTANGALSASANFSMSFWMKSPPEGLQIPFLQTSDGAATNAKNNFDISPLNELRFWGDNSFQTVQTPLIADGNWHHVAIVSTSLTASLNIFIDGVDVPLLMTNPDSPSVLESTLCIGARSDLLANDTYDYTGLIDELKIFNVALQNQDITDLFMENTPPNLAPVAHFPFEEGTGLTTVDISNGLTGSMNNMSNASWVPGISGAHALDFDGTDDDVYVAPAPIINDIFSGGGSVSFFIEPRSWGIGQSHVITKWNDNEGWFIITDSRTQGVRFLHDFCTNEGKWNTTGTINLNEVTHVIITYDNSSSTNQPTIYYNGVATTTIVNLAANGSPTSDASKTLIMGGIQGGTKFFDGIIDDVRLFDHILSPTEAADLYNDIAPPEPLEFSSLEPFNGESNVPTDANLILSFPENIDLMGGNVELYENSGFVDAFDKNSSFLMALGNSLVIDPPSDLMPSSNVHILIDPGMITGNVSANVFAGFSTNTEWAFTTASNGTGGGGPSQPLVLTEHTPFMTPPALAAGSMDNIVLMFELQGGANIEVIDGFRIDVSGNIEDLAYYELIDVTSTPVLLYGGNFWTGDEDGGNIDFSGNPFAVPAHGSNVLELKVSISHSISGDNISFAQSTLGLFSSNTVVGNLQSSGLISLSGAPAPPADSSGLGLGLDTFYLLEEGEVLARGRNDLKQLGRSSNLHLFESADFTGTLVGFAVGASHVVAFDDLGRIVTWGDNSFGQSKNDGSVAIDNSIGNVVQVSAGAYSSHALNDAGELWVKGRNHLGQLGLGDTTNRNIWTKVLNLPTGNIVKIAAGYEHLLLLMDDGDLYGFGSNGYGQLSLPGDGFFTSQILLVTGFGVVDIAAGAFHSVMVNSNDDLGLFGKNSGGQLGSGGFSAFEATPQSVTPGVPVLKITAGLNHTLFLLDTGMGQKQAYICGSLGDVQSPNPVVAHPAMVVDDIASGPSSVLFRRGDIIEIMGKGPDGELYPQATLLLDLNP